MRVPNAGQDLVERRIVREGKRLAEVMLADYTDPPGLLSIDGLSRLFRSWPLALWRGLSPRH